MVPHLRVGWCDTDGYSSFPGGGEHWGGNGVGSDMYSFAFDGQSLWTGTNDLNRFAFDNNYI